MTKQDEKNFVMNVQGSLIGVVIALGLNFLYNYYVSFGVSDMIGAVIFIVLGSAGFFWYKAIARNI